MSSAIAFFSISKDIFPLIATYLDPRDLLTFSRVNKSCHTLSNDERIWKAVAMSLGMNLTSPGIKRQLQSRITQACLSVQIAAISSREFGVTFSSSDPFERYQ
ncbi:MAG: F-box-like domain-containing protein, partial [Anaerolineae bacterium]